MEKHISVLCILAAGISMSAAAAYVPSVDEDRAVGTETLVRQADSLRCIYRFREAVSLYDRAEQLLLQRDTAVVAEDSLREAVSVSDSILLENIASRKVMAENGISMSRYVGEPVVVARHVFSKSDFYLFYPMQDRSWREVPNPLDSIPGHRFVNATYIPDGSSDIYFSAVDDSGVRNIYHTHFKDSVWSAPVLLDESLTSSGDEIFPVLSADGNTLYFSSSGLYGAGGYDLYRTDLDRATGTWSIPENLGFPYSSPYDDLLFFNTPDGKYSMFASDRDCSRDSIMVYVLEYDSMPVRRSVDDPVRLHEIASLVPVDDPSRMDTETAVGEGAEENADIGRYMSKMEEVKVLRDSIAIYGRSLEEKRSLLEESRSAEEKERMTSEILRQEARIPALQDSLAKASGILQQIEMEFLYNGVVIDPDKVMAQAEREVTGVASNYVFARLSPGGPLSMSIEKPEAEFDYSFMILPEGRFARDNTIPDGIVYQIQMCLLSAPATVGQLKGLSPVFIEKTAAGGYIHRVGLFRSYNDVLSNLNKVKSLGFKTAFIVAFADGRKCTVQKARTLESQMRNSAVYRIEMTPEGGELPDLTLKAIRQVTDRDIAKVSEDGMSVFIVGPLASREEAEKLISLIKSSGVEKAEIVKSEKQQ